MKEFIFYPVDHKDEKEKEEKSHYIYVCTKNNKWRETYKEHIEAELIKLILHEKAQGALDNDSKAGNSDE